MSREKHDSSRSVYEDKDYALLYQNSVRVEYFATCPPPAT